MKREVIFSELRSKIVEIFVRLYFNLVPFEIGIYLESKLIQLPSTFTCEYFRGLLSITLRSAFSPGIKYGAPLFEAKK